MVQGEKGVKTGTRLGKNICHTVNGALSPQVIRSGHI